MGLALTLVLLLSVHAYASPAFSTEDAMDTLGVNIHFTDAKPGELDELRAAGFHWVRMDFVWDGTERSPGNYDFSAYDRLMDQLRRYKLHALFILDYANPLYDDGLALSDDPGRAAYARWAAAAVSHFAGNGIVWEIYNEPNTRFWRPHPDSNACIEMALAACKAIKSAEPSETVIGPACATFDWSFLESVLRSGLLQYWSGVSVHPYRGSPPETVTADYRHLQELIDQNAPVGRKIPIVCGEWGYSTDEANEADYLPRELLTNIEDGVPLSIWYDWHDDGVNPANPEHHFGVVHNTYQAGASLVYSPKAAYQALLTLTHSLDGMHFVSTIDVGNPVTNHVLYFTGSRGVCYAAWTAAPLPTQISVPFQEGHYRVESYLGAGQGKIDSGLSGAEIILTSAPTYYFRPPFGLEFRDKQELFPTP